MMNVKLAGLTWMYNPFPLERAFAGIAGAGYNYVAFGLRHEGIEQPDENDSQAVGKVRALLDRYGLRPVMLVCTKQLALGQPFERANRHLDAAQQLGIWRRC
jgi:sugar phosphate isomerase/epimerase